MAKMDFKPWRHDVAVIEPGQTHEVVFLDTKPNLFYVQNHNSAIVYVGLSRIPKENEHEFKVNPFKSDAFGSPMPRQRIYLYNPSGQTISVDVFSHVNEFDMSILKQFDVSVGDVSFDGMIRGFTTALPAGSNTIGNVNLVGGVASSIQQAMEALSSNMLTLKNEVVARCKKLNRSELQNVTMSGTSHSISVGADNARLNFICNDSNEDITLKTETISGTGSIVNVTVKAGEVLSDLWLTDVENITITGVAGVELRYCLEVYS